MHLGNKSLNLNASYIDIFRQIFKKKNAIHVCAGIKLSNNLSSLQQIFVKSGGRVIDEFFCSLGVA